MATSFAHTHSHRIPAGIRIVPNQQTASPKAVKRSVVGKFFSDLFEDLRQKPLQAAKFAKHDMFREHINAMSISYFALILLLIVGSIFLLPALIPILTQ